MSSRKALVDFLLMRTNCEPSLHCKAPACVRRRDIRALGAAVSKVLAVAKESGAPAANGARLVGGEACMVSDWLKKVFTHEPMRGPEDQEASESRASFAKDTAPLICRAPHGGKNGGNVINCRKAPLVARQRRVLST